RDLPSFPTRRSSDLADHLRERHADLRGGHRSGDGDEHLSAALQMADVIVGRRTQRGSVEMAVMLLNEIVNRRSHRARILPAALQDRKSTRLNSSHRT